MPKGMKQENGRTMKASHQGLGINNSQFNAFVNDIAVALEETKKVSKKEADQVLEFALEFQRRYCRKVIKEG